MPGVRQKRARAEAANRKPVGNSRVAELLVLSVVLGHISPQFCQKVAAACRTDLETVLEGYDISGELDKLASIGNSGNSIQSCRRDLFNSVLQVPKLVGQVLMLPFKCAQAASGWKQESTIVLFPHETFACMFEHYTRAWQKLIYPGRDKVFEFWSAMQSHPLLDNNPVRAIANYMTHVVPFWLHGDGVATTGVGKAWAKMMDAVSFGSMLASGSTIDCCFISWAVYKVRCCKAGGVGHTMHAYWSALAWSFDALFSGKWPTHDHLGNAYDPDSPQGKRADKPLVPLPDGTFLRGMLFNVKCDLDFSGNDLELSNVGSHRGCTYCPATRDPLDTPWYDFSRDIAAWVGATFTNQSWQLARPATGISLFRLMFVSCLSVGQDGMHIKHLGCDRYFYGSVLWLLVFEVLDDSPTDNMKFIFGRIQQFYRDNNYNHRRYSTYKNIHIGMFCWSSQPFARYPQLKGKAAEIHHLGPALLLIWQELTAGVAADDATQLVGHFSDFYILPRICDSCAYIVVYAHESHIHLRTQINRIHPCTNMNRIHPCSHMNRIH